MCLPEMPKAPVTATRTLAPHQVRIVMSLRHVTGIVLDLPMERRRELAVPCERPCAPETRRYSGRSEVG
jgi:hypothetical protein